MQRKLFPGSLKLLASLMASMGLYYSSHAASVGDLRVGSSLGQPFSGRVVVDLNPGEDVPEPRCIRVIPDGGDLPSIGPAYVQVREGRGQSTLQIRSTEVVNEPVVAFTVEMSCGQIQWSRQFTVFLDPAPVPLENTVDAARVSAPVLPRPANSKPLKQDASLSQIAARYYSVNSKAYARYLERLQKANPAVLDPDQPLPAGTPVVFPPRPKPAPVPKPPQPATEDAAQPVLSLTEPGSKAESRPDTSRQTPEGRQASYVAELERKLALMEELHGKLEQEVSQLQARLNELNASAVAMQSAGMPASVASAAAPAKPNPTAAPGSSETPRRTQVEHRSLAWAWLGLAGVLLGGGIAFWIWRMRRRQRDEWDDEQIGSGFAAARTAVMTQLAMRAARRRDEPASTQQSQFRHTVMLAGIEVDDSDVPLMDRATLLISQGEISDAIEVLHEAINENPSDVERWLMLFRLFRQQAMKSDYASLARRFLAQKHEADDWELVRNIGARLDPENVLYERKQVDEPARDEPQQPLGPDEAFSAALAVPVAEPAVASKPGHDEELMDFLGKQEPAVPPPAYAHVEPPEPVSLDLPELDLGAPVKLDKDIAAIDKLDDAPKSG